MKNYIFTVFALVIFTSISAQDYYHRFYSFTEVSRHLPWNFLIEEEDFLLKVGMDFCQIDGGVCTSLLRVAKDTNGDVYAVGRKTVIIDDPTNIPHRDSVWIVKTNSEGCLDDLDCGREEVLTSIKRNASLAIDIPLSVHPNPVGDIMTIESQIQFTSYGIHNSLGQLLQAGDLDSNTIGVSRLNKGIYFLTVYTKDQKFKTEKIIKN